MKLEAKQILRMDHQAVFSVLSLRSHWRSAKCAVNVGGWNPYVAKSGYRDADKLEKLGCVDADALVNCKGAQKNEGAQSDDCDRIAAQSFSVAREEASTTPRASRVEETFPCWRKRRELKREKHLTKISISTGVRSRK